MNRSTRLASPSSVERRSRRLRLARAAVEAVEARRLLASVAGVLFNDANANGTRQTGEAGLANEVVYADRNNNNVYDGTDVATRTDASGAYKLANLPADAAAITIRLRGDAGGRVVAPAGNGYAVKLTAASPDLVGKDFAVRPVATTPTGTVTITGRAYVDNDRSGTYTPGDTTTAGTVYATTNPNGYQNGEPTTGRNADGTYTLTGVPAGKAVTVVALKVVPNANLFQTVTTPANGGALNVDFIGQPSTTTPPPAANTVSGRVTNDANGNGVADAGEAGLYFEVVYLDKNNNGAQDSGEAATRTDASGNYAFANVALDGSTVGIRVRNGAPRVITAPAGGAYVLTLNAASTKTNLNFSISPKAVPPTGTTTTTIVGRAFVDRDSTNTYTAGDGTAVGTVFADLNTNLKVDAGEPTTRRAADGTFTLAGVPAGKTVNVVALNVDGTSTFKILTTTTPANGGTVTGFAIIAPAPAQPTTATVSGRVTNDANRNGVADAGEGGIAGVAVFADYGGDGRFTAGTDPSTTTSADGTFSLTTRRGAFAVRLALPFSGLAASGDAAGVPAMSSTIVIQTGPAANAGRSIDVTSGVGAANVGFSAVPAGYLRVAPRTAALDGNATARFNDGRIFVWLDRNANGKRDADEPLAARDNGSDNPSPYDYSVYAGYSFLVPTGVPQTVAFGASGAVGAAATLTYRATVAANAGPAGVVGLTVPTTDAAVFGHVFFDANGNGVEDGPDSIPAGGVTSFKVFADYNKNGTIEAGEPTTFARYDSEDASYNGYYYLPVTPGRAFALGIVGESSPRYQTLAPQTSVAANSTRVLNVGLNDTIPPQAIVTGRVTGDGGVGVRGVTAYADYDADGVPDAGEPTATTDDAGYFALSTKHDALDVRVALGGTAYVQTTPAAGAGRSLNTYAVAAIGGQDFVVTAQAASVRGRVYDDANGNGVADAGEAGFARAYVYADYNGNGRFDAGEPEADSAADGTYVLTTARAQFAVRLRPVSNSIDDMFRFFVDPISPTQPAGDAGVNVDVRSTSAKSNVNVRAVNGAYVRTAPQLSNLDPEGFYALAGQPTYGWVDANRNGQRDAAEPVVTGDDRYGSHASSPDSYSYYSFLLKRGTHVVAFGSSDAVNAKAVATATVIVTATTPKLVYAPAITVPTIGASVSGVVFEDRDRDGVLDANEVAPYGTVVSEVSQYSPFADYNDNGIVDAGEPTGYVSFDSNQDVRYYDGYYVIHGIQPGRAFSVRLAYPVRYGVRLDQTNVPRVTVAANQFLRGVNLGTAEPTSATISGRVTNDANANGAVDAGEAGLSFEIVYLDRNNNGLPDTGETAVRTDANGYYSIPNVALDGSILTVRLRSIFAPRKVTAPAGNGYVVTLDANAQTSGLNFGIAPAPVVGGRVFNDANYSRTFDAGEGGLGGVTVFADYNHNGVVDGNEPSTTTLADGSYALSTNRADFQVRAAFSDATYALTQPLDGYDYAFLTTAQQATVNFGFGRIATVSGRVNEDANRNGRPDAGEGGIAGVLVYADYDGDGQTDYLEPTATTDANGVYSFDTRRAAFSVRVAQPSPGYPSTNYAVQLTSATTNNGVAIDVTSASKKVDVNFSGARLTEVSIAPHLANADEEAFYRFGGGPRFAWVDVDHDGVRDANEPLVGTNRASLDRGASWPTYEFLLPLGAYEIDFATSGEVGATAAVRKTGTVTTSTPAFIGLDGTVPTTESIAFGRVAGARPDGFQGTVYADYNDNGRLDSGEPVAATFDGGITYGTYNDYFALHVDPGRAFTVRVTDLRPNSFQTVAPRLTVAANQFLTNADVTVVNRTAAIVGGHLYYDSNRNGSRDAGETSVTDATAFVFADYDNDGVLQSNEPTNYTNVYDSDVTYGIDTIKGAFTLRLHLAPGYVQTSPTNGGARFVDLTNADYVDGQDFGIAPA